MLDKTTTDRARVIYYTLLAKFFTYSTLEDRFENLDDILSIISINALDDYTKDASLRLLKVIDTKGYEAISAEYDELFHSVESENIQTSASFYDEEYEAGRKLVEVRSFIAKTAIRRNEKVFSDHEDTVAFLLNFMADLIEQNSTPHYSNIQHCIFTQIINPFIDKVIKRVFEHEKSDIYKDVAIILNSFVEFERLYFEVSKPKVEAPRKTRQEMEEEAEQLRRAKNRAKKEADKAI